MSSHLFLLREMVKRDFKSRYAGSVGGLLWSLAQPLWQLLLFTWIFAIILKFDLKGELTDRFAIFLFAGLIPWLAFNEGVTRSATAIIDNGDLVKKVRFPSELLVFSIVIGALLHSAIACLIFVGATIYFREISIVGLPLLLLVLPLQIALTLGLGFLVASLQVFFRDAIQILTMLMTGWFYFTPIVFPLGAIQDETLKSVLRLNPMTPIVELYRSAFLGGSLGPLTNYASLFVAAPAAILLGMFVYRRLSPGFVDEL